MSEESSTACKPNFLINIAENKLSASLSIIQNDLSTLDITVDDIYDALKINNITFGVLDAKLEELVLNYNSSKDAINNVLIASGIASTAGKIGDIVPTGNILLDATFFDEIQSSIDSHIYDIIQKDKTLKKIEIGNEIGRRSPNVLGTDGTDVLGHLIENQEYLASDFKVGPNATEDNNTNIISATKSGLACFVDSCVDVLEVACDSCALVEVSSDKMSVNLTITPAAKNSKNLVFTDIKDLLKVQKVEYGINESSIKQALADVLETKLKVKMALIASGKPAINGENATIEYLFNTKGTLAPEQMEGGGVDFKNVSLIETVKDGQTIAKIVPAQKGVLGMDIFNKELPALDGKSITPPLGKNTLLDSTDSNNIIAKTGGNIRLTAKLIEVSEGYAVDGDVDYHVGNINYNKSVLIAGDIKSGFTIDIGGDLEVGGLVEDAKINTKGHVLIKGGFVGSGAGIINSRGAINLNFVHNQLIKSGTDITVAREALHSTLMSRNRIMVLGKTMSIVGGKVSARNEIIAHVVGNEQGTKTHLEVGIDFTLLEEKYKAEKKLKELAENKVKINENITKFDKLKIIKKKLEAKQEFLFKKLKEMLIKIEAQEIALAKRKEMINKNLYEIGKSKIIVNSRIYPGVHITIGDCHHTISEEINSKKTIMVVNSEIKIL